MRCCLKCNGKIGSLLRKKASALDDNGTDRDSNISDGDLDVDYTSFHDIDEQVKAFVQYE